MTKKTALYDTHCALGARLVDFAGWLMPVQYSGTIAEHTAVRESAGLFDVSHMGEFDFTGPDACACLQRLTANDVSALTDGRAQYSMFLNPEGGIVDDVIVYRHNAEYYTVVVNAGNLAHDWGWVNTHKSGDVTITDRSNDWALLALQGPKVDAILQRLVSHPLETIPRFGFANVAMAEANLLIARTGYTGEAGFEIFVPTEYAHAVWQHIMEAGSTEGLLPCGLAARDTLRLEMAYPLHGNDISSTTTPLEARLGWVVKLNAGEFIGSTALREQKAQGLPRKLVGLRMIDRAIPRHGFAIIHNDIPVGEVTSGSMSPSLGIGIALGYVPTALAEVGTRMHIDVRGKAREAEVVALPFYQPAS